MLIWQGLLFELTLMLGKADFEEHKLYTKLPKAFKILEHEDASAVSSESALDVPCDAVVLKDVLEDAFTTDPNVKGDFLVSFLQMLLGNR